MGGFWIQLTWMLLSCNMCLSSLSEPKGSSLLVKAVTPSSQGSPWPMPQSITVMPDVYTLVGQSQFMFTATKVQCDILDSAFKRYLGIIFFHKPEMTKRSKFPSKHLHFSADELRGINVAVDQPCPDYPQLESDESYTLTISEPTAALTATSVWGALRGLETFSQLIYDGQDGTLVVNKSSISDYPRFKHRGYLVDSSRHFLSMSSIFKSLDAMAYNKFNVFHWHIVDDQSFPYESQAYPSLSRMNAYDQNHVYTRENIKAVIEYARLRGIRVMAEFDTPGHTQSWVSIPDLLTPCYSGTTPNGGYGPINPTIDANYEFLKVFFKEVVDLFPDKYVHMGGDEVSFACWQSNPNITAFMQEHQFGKNYSKLEEYYEQRLLDIMADLQSGYTVWQEIIDNQVKVKGNTIVHVWKGGWQSTANRVTQKGYRALISSPYYLNRVSSPYPQPWHNLYKVDPTNFNGTDAQKKLVIGGEVCMWGEYVDSTNIIQRTWPRASAVGERLWSSENVTSVGDAAPRLVEQRCRMVKRGLQAEPITGPNYCPYEYED